MKVSVKEHSDFNKTILSTTILCVAFAAAAICIRLFMPAPSDNLLLDEVSVQNAPVLNEERLSLQEPITGQNVSWILNKESFNTIKIDSLESSVDKGLELYRNPSTRAAVEWFYIRITGRRDVTMAILEAANREDIPLSLAFALCYTESRYNRYARNLNTNGSIDRGLFQLNDRSFPRLENDDFYAPEVSARYGMQHLRFCMNVAGNDMTALAMYNAGVSRVRNDHTPRSTLRYVGRIVNYRSNLETSFAEEVLSHYRQSEQQIVPLQ